MKELNIKIIDLLNKKVTAHNSGQCKLPRNYFSIVLKPHLDEIIFLLEDLSLPQVYELLVEQGVIPKQVDLKRFSSWFYKLKIKNNKKKSLYKNLVKYNKQVNLNSEISKNETNHVEDLKNISAISDSKKSTKAEIVKQSDISNSIELLPYTFEFYSAKNNSNVDEVLNDVRYSAYPTQKDYVLSQYAYLSNLNNNFIHANKKGIITWLTRINYLLGVAKKFNKNTISLDSHIELPDDFESRDYTFNPSSDLTPLNPYDERYPFVCKSDLFAYDDHGIIYDVNTLLPVPWIYMPNMREVVGVPSSYNEIDCRKHGNVISQNVIEQTLRDYFVSHSGQKMDVIRINL